MENRITLKSWSYAENQQIKLEYNDGDTVMVSKADFDRAFGAIVSASKDDVIRDFAVKKPKGASLDTVLADVQSRSEQQAHANSSPAKDIPER